MKADTAREVVQTLQSVVYAERATGGLARVEGVRVAGKTGTGVFDLPGGDEAYYSTFVGLVPSTATRFVILVGVDQAKGHDLSGGTIAAPVFARVASRALAAQ
jgi:cell division protein FtsI (penicillin-binding protein 3)